MSSNEVEIASFPNVWDGSRPFDQPSADNDLLTARTGKNPVLKRRYGSAQILSFSSLMLITWPSTLILLGVGLVNGGPAGIIYSYIFVWAGTLAVFSTLAELASMAPTAGGQYHWVSILAPASSRKLLSYVSGWLTVTGWQANVAACSFAFGQTVQGFIQVLDSTAEAKLWVSASGLYAVLAVSILINIFLGPALPMIEIVLMILYILGFFGVLIPFVYLGPHGNAHNVFTTFINLGNWSTQGLSLCVGISGMAFVFLGADSIYHMSEETHNAATVVPSSIIRSIVINGLIGFGMLLAVLFNLGDLESVLKTKFSLPFIQIFLNAIRSSAGVAAILMLLLVLQLGLVVGIVAASSRQLWSFARDKGAPKWQHVKKVRRGLPIIAILVTFLLPAALGIISFFSPVAFNNVISETVSALYGSYLLPCLFLLWRRIGGTIKDYSESLPSEGQIFLVGSQLAWGPWRMPKMFGTLVNGLACAYLIFVLFFSFWPPATPVTPNTMNYSGFVSISVVVMSGLYYYFDGHKTYTGPVVEIRNFT